MISFNFHVPPTRASDSLCLMVTMLVPLRIRIRIYLLARRNLLWDILRLPSSRRAALGLYVILTLWRGRGANQPPYALLHRSSPRYALRHGRRPLIEKIPLFTDFERKITPYFSQNQDFCCKKKSPFFPISRRAHCVVTPFETNLGHSLQL